MQLEYWRLDLAEEYVQEALRRDPSYAPAHALLAHIYNLRAYRSAVAPREIKPRARVAAKKALELDETLAEGHAALASVLAHYDWDWSGAETEYRRALELNPALVWERTVFSLFLSAMERHEEAIAEAERAVELDPLSPQSSMNLGRAFNFAGRYEEATRQLQATIEAHPNFDTAYFHLGASYGRRGMYEEAITAIEEAIRLTDGGTLSQRAWLGHYYALSGRNKEALAILDELEELEKRRFVPPLAIAAIYIGLNRKEQALQRLEEAYEVHDGYMYLLKVLPLPFIQSEPRFQDLLRRMNFPE
jgi:serine/threonine-protein kinase